MICPSKRRKEMSESEELNLLREIYYTLPPSDPHDHELDKHEAAIEAYQKWQKLVRKNSENFVQEISKPCDSPDRDAEDSLLYWLRDQAQKALSLSQREGATKSGDRAFAFAEAFNNVRTHIEMQKSKSTQDQVQKLTEKLDELRDDWHTAVSYSNLAHKRALEAEKHDEAFRKDVQVLVNAIKVAAFQLNNDDKTFRFEGLLTTLDKSLAPVVQKLEKLK
jgi:hypothetical protein